MFAIGFLLVGGVFVLLVIGIGKTFPLGAPRKTYFVAVIGLLVAYPFIYLLTPAYWEFNDLCESKDRYQALKTKPVDFIFIEWGYSSDCTSGPAFIEDYGYLGFDCKLRGQKEAERYRYTKNLTWKKGCGLECFDAVRLQGFLESNYLTKNRYGFIDSNKAVLTDGYRVVESKASRQSEKLVFHDQLLVDESGEIMSYGRDYIYYPYGDGWAKILGLASGSAPSKTCKTQFVPMDLRDVYKPAHAG